MDVAVRMSGISRRFGTVVALDHVDLEVRTGEVHALVGENGAGKTSLMRILYGSDRADQGTIELHGRQVRFHSAAEGIAAGIGMVSQHYSIIPELTCLQNLMLGAEPGPIYAGAPAQHRAQALAERMGFHFDWHAPAATLGPAGAQKLEILKLLWRNSQVMILDEPTAMLSPADADALFESLHRLAADGATVIVVTHRLPEVLEHCQRVTVLRGGKRVASHDVAGLSAPVLAELIVGRAVDMTPRETGELPGDVVLDIRDLVARGHRGDDALKRASLRLRRGEMLGIAGVDGSGQRELFWTLCGLLRARSGTVVFDGQEWTHASPQRRLEGGLRLIPEDRHEEGVVEAWSLEENAALGLQRLPGFRRGPWIDAEGRRARAQAMVERFRTKCDSLQAPMVSLSGGNQQRFVAGRALEACPRLILAFQPARGLDIEATRQVFAAIADACAGGAAALIVSFDLDELLTHCDRIVVMHGGHLVEPAAGQERDRAAIGRLMVGAT